MIPRNIVPTPMDSMRYMVTKDSSNKNDNNLFDMGFNLEPIINSCNFNRSIGAKISSFLENDSNKQCNMRCGDEIYKINNELMRIAPFHMIQQRLHEISQEKGIITIIFERGSLVTCVPPKPESILKIQTKIHHEPFRPKRVFFEGKHEVCLYQDNRSNEDNATTPGVDNNSVSYSHASSDVVGSMENDQLVHSIFSPSMRNWRRTNASLDEQSDSWTVGSQECRQAVLEKDASISCEPLRNPKDASIQRQYLGITNVPFVAPPQDAYSNKDHGEQLNQTDYWSYSSASSPVGLNLVEESQSQTSEAKTFISSPESSFFPIPTDSFSFNHPLRGPNIQYTKNMTTLQHHDIPTVVYKKDVYNKNLSDDGSVSTVYMSPLSVRPEISGLLLKDRDSLQEDLEGKVSSMRRAVQTLERQIFNQTQEASNKISTLEMSQASAEMEITRLGSICVSSTNEAREIRKQLNAKQSELNLLKETLERERCTFKARADKAEELNSDLRAQVKNLSSQLEIQKNKTANARQLAEIELRKQLDAERNDDKQLIAELCAELKKATHELQDLMDENNTLSRKICDFESKIKNETKPPPVIFVDIVKELTAAQAAASAIAKALVQSEHELALCIEAKSDDEKVIELMKQEAATLKSQNMEFEDRILIISHQLKQSNAVVDKLSKELKESPNHNYGIEKIRAEWSSAKLKYEQQIVELRKTIEKYSSFVPQEEYNRVKIDSEKNASALLIKLEEINALSVKVKDLEDRLKRSVESLQLAETTRPIANSSLSHIVDQPNPVTSQPSSSGCNGSSPKPNLSVDKIEETTKTDANVVNEGSSPPPPKQCSPTSTALLKFSSLSRREIIRAAGGHAALKERLDKSRSAMNRSKETDSDATPKSSPAYFYPFRNPLATIQGNGRALAVRFASSHGKENVTGQ